jgi:hypothetical protein
MFNKLGIFSGNEYFKIFVELPYVGYRMSNYRDVLTEEADYDRRPVMFNDHIHGIRDNMPSSIKQKISEHNIGVTTSDVEELLKDELKKFDYNSILANGIKVPGGNGGVGVGSLHSDSEPNPDREIRKRKKNINPVPRKTQQGNTKGMVTISNILPIFQIYDHNLVIENEMSNTFARLTIDGADGRDLIAINPQHCIINNLLANISHDEEISEELRTHAIMLLQVKLGVYVVLTKSETVGSNHSISDVEFETLTKDCILSLTAKQADIAEQLRRKAKELELIEKNKIDEVEEVEEVEEV